MSQISPASFTTPIFPAIAYRDIPVLMTEMLAQAYEVKPIQIQQNFANNKDRFVEGKHFFTITNGELKAFRLQLENFESQISPKVRALTLWTERGAARHAKMLNSDKAWDVFELLEETFFRVVKPEPVENPDKLTQADAPITPDQQCTLRAIVKAKIGDEKNRGKLMRFYGQVWSRFANHFRIARYSQLPQSRMSEAVQYLVNLSIQPKGLDARPEQKMPEQRGLSTLDITVDQTTYEYKKRLFDQLGELLIKMETLRENIHLMGRPGARSAMLSAEKQVLYENMDDCVNGAVTGLNIAVYNLRSACRIGSRTTFCKW